MLLAWRSSDLLRHFVWRRSQDLASLPVVARCFEPNSPCCRPATRRRQGTNSRIRQVNALTNDGQGNVDEKHPSQSRQDRVRSAVVIDEFYKALPRGRSARCRGDIPAFKK
jgi:hypothetical protein